MRRENFQIGAIVVPKDRAWLWARKQDLYLLTVVEIYPCTVPRYSRFWVIKLRVDILNAWGQSVDQFLCPQFADDYELRTTPLQNRLESAASVVLGPEGIAALPRLTE